MTALSISVIIPTFCRPEDLLRAARSVFGQSLIGQVPCTLIIIDNDPAASAADAIEILRGECPDGLTFVSAHEPRAGVSNARNRAMSLVSTDLIAFLDDDQSAANPDWLETLYALHMEFKPAVCFGPLVTQLPESVTEHIDYFSAFFGRSDPSPRGLIDQYHGGCNTLIDVAKLPPQRPLFAESANEAGGEDDILFEQIEMQGGTFAWEPDAPVFEHVPVHRARLGYTLKRAFAYGQGPCTNARLRKDWPALLFWIGVGGVKFLWHGLRAGAFFLFHHPDRARELDLAVRGGSKVLFWHSVGLYGTAMLKPSNRLRQSKSAPESSRAG